MTALVGIVPTRGSVLDPFRFKVITGGANIATNALYLPEGIKNIVWSGIATGNREMSCVRGELHSVTFTFEDGTIITRNSQADQGKNKLGGNLLGYISDRRGNPCLPGKLITNASDYLKDRMIASGFAAAAEGVAVTQQTTTISDEGNVQQFFDGSTGDFIAAKTLQGGLNELTGYLRERQANAIDLVFISGGLDLVVHVETQINIDYQPDGRKLHHASTTQNKLASFNLD
jgi:integrating conjugative element protein (TIGR03752 family)